MNSVDRHHRIGILGAGNIFSRYVDGLRRQQGLTIVRVGDIDVDRAHAAAVEHDITAWGGPGELYADESVEIIVNLTPPSHHAETIIAALRSQKDVYVEKPIATTLAAAAAVLDVARDTGRLLGSAPDTFLGSASQTARQALDAGLIGEPIAAAFFTGHSRAELWHPDPSFLFRAGGGPALDIGPYYLAVLVNLLGPVRSVVAHDRVGVEYRTVTAPNRLVDKVAVEVPTHTAAILTFASGVICAAQMSFDVWDSDLPHIEIYGSAGTLSLANPNHYDGPVRVKAHDDRDWHELEPVTDTFGSVATAEQRRRGLGVRDLINAIDGGTHRANAHFAVHVLEALSAIDASARKGQEVRLTTGCDRPAAVVGLL